MNKLHALAEKHGGKLLSTNIIKGRKLLWQCNEGHTFWLTPYKVKRRGKWCMQCGSSIGEREIRAILRDGNLKFSPQYSLPVLPTRRYDFYFEYQNQKYLVEFDGEQHFKFVRKLHHTKRQYLEKQIIDRIKTYAAWTNGFHLIRIDYTQMNQIKDHLMRALSANQPVYFSTPEMYRYLTEANLQLTELQKYAPLLCRQ